MIFYGVFTELVDLLCNMHILWAEWSWCLLRSLKTKMPETKKINECLIILTVKGKKVPQLFFMICNSLPPLQTEALLVSSVFPYITVGERGKARAVVGSVRVDLTDRWWHTIWRSWVSFTLRGTTMFFFTFFYYVLPHLCRPL